MAGKKKSSSQGQLDFQFESKPAGSKTAKKKAATQKTKTAAKKTGEKNKPATPKKTTPAPKRKTKTTRKRTATPSFDSMESRAEDMASRQREISVSEFFAKNRHLLGFDNPSKALLTAVKEAVDNSLDACEEAQILPEIEVGIRQVSESRYRLWVQDNGPGIVKAQIPNIFGRLLYGSKFHTLRMARGQQGIGISAAGMYGLLTTGKNVKINSKTGSRSQAHHYELRIDTKKNRPEIIKDEVIEWDVTSGTRVEIELEARYQRGRQSVDEYLKQTAITNPHAKLTYTAPDDQSLQFDRTVNEIVSVPKAVKPHPYGVELGVLMKMAKETAEKTMSGFLCHEFSRVSSRISQQILDKAKISTRFNPSRLDHPQAEKLYESITKTKIMAPSTDCVVPIGQEELLKGLQQVVQADFYTSCTRSPTVYRGNPFQIEVALAYGSGGYNGQTRENIDQDNPNHADQQELMRVLRFANRVPLLYQQSGCAIFKAIMQTNWRSYGLSQSRGALPGGPVTVIAHIASVWVPFTSESKEAVAGYPEIIKELKLALADCGRHLGRYLRGVKRQRDEAVKKGYIKKYLPAIGEALTDILDLKKTQLDNVLENLEQVLEQSRNKS